MQKNYFSQWKGYSRAEQLCMSQMFDEEAEKGFIEVDHALIVKKYHLPRQRVVFYKLNVAVEQVERDIRADQEKYANPRLKIARDY